MCGSGTLLSEALMHYCRIPAGRLRQKFGFERLPDFEPRLWRSVRKSEDSRIRPLPERLIAGSDIAAEAVAVCRANNRRLPHGERVHVDQRDFRRLEELGHRVIVCNPPYGIRLAAEADLGEFYREFGNFLKQRCQGSTAYVYFGNREMLKHIGLKPSWKRPLKNGGLDGRLARFELY